MAHSPFSSQHQSSQHRSSQHQSSRWTGLVRSSLIGFITIQSILLTGINVAYAEVSQTTTSHPKNRAETRQAEQSTPRTPRNLSGRAQRSPSSNSPAITDNTPSDDAFAGLSFRERLRRFSNAVFVPPQEGAPRDTATAGSREEDRCTGDAMPMRSLMPENEYGLTFASRPTISLEMPETQAEQAVLLFETEAGEIHAQSYLPIPEPTENGIVQFQLPDTTPELSVGQPYRWSLAVICNQALDPSDPLFRGWVTRTVQSPETVRMLSTVPVDEQVAWLSEQGYWYEMVSLLIANPKIFADRQYRG